MPQDDQPSRGLLSKVARFVRGPTLGWSDQHPAEDRESRYSKQVLKEMIERKRANDFVRRREFDQLRRLRRRGTAGTMPAPLSSAAPSFFDSDQPGNTERAGTLQKIDEIEAQMAQQWPRPRAGGEAMPSGEEAQHSRQFAPTVHSGLSDGVPRGADESRQTDFAATDVIPPSERPDARAGAAPAEDMLPGLDLSFGAAAVDEVLQLDPSLEEAAIRFANGDDQGAEAALLAVLDGGAPLSARRRAWAALFDLYRATGQQARFDAMAIDFAMRGEGAAPAWRPIAEPAASPADEAERGAGGQHDWTCPGVLGADDVVALAVQAAERRPAVLRLDWSPLVTLQFDAVEPLVRLLADWAGRETRLHCGGTAQLELLLRQHTVSGQREQPADWWRLRLAWLRVAHRPDEFDLVGLEYCITYEVPPPAWEPSRCGFSTWEPGAGSAPSGTEPAPDGALSGVVRGDAMPALAAIAGRAGAGEPLVVDCQALVRIDFAAAGSVLNWAAEQQGAGRHVRFQGMHRLVALFFHVIGVAEHATILPYRG
ncbi:STAS domain-containing protein [Pseudorhodoferax sp.]|uniref:STAS domain-containing protein n=1 Tax=Pseudorhodoferax sp. TaxID=1993553 RepID=UPI0039E58A97